LRDDGGLQLERHPSDPGLLASLRDDWNVRRLAWFSKGFYSVREAAPGEKTATASASTAGQLLGLVETAEASGQAADGRGRAVVVSDLRMGETPWLVFSFIVAEHRDGRVVAVSPRQVTMPRVPPDAFARLWERLVGCGDTDSPQGEAVLRPRGCS